MPGFKEIFNLKRIFQNPLTSLEHSWEIRDFLLLNRPYVPVPAQDMRHLSWSVYYPTGSTGVCIEVSRFSVGHCAWDPKLNISISVNKLELGIQTCVLSYLGG